MTGEPLGVKVSDVTQLVERDASVVAVEIDGVGERIVVVTTKETTNIDAVRDPRQDPESVAKEQRYASIGPQPEELVDRVPSVEAYVDV